MTNLRWDSLIESEEFNPEKPWLEILPNKMFMSGERRNFGFYLSDEFQAKSLARYTKVLLESSNSQCLAYEILLIEAILAITSEIFPSWEKEYFTHHEIVRRAAVLKQEIGITIGSSVYFVKEDEEERMLLAVNATSGDMMIVDTYLVLKQK
jgi:hypothetical protein